MKYVHLKWEDRYSLEVDAMYKVHQELIVFINKMFDAMETEDYSQMQIAFVNLANFVVKHFKDEEAFMDKHEFTGRETHKLTHKKLLESMGEFESQIKTKKLDKDRLHGFLRVWLSSHIMGIDRKYADEIVPKLKKVA